MQDFGKDLLYALPKLSHSISKLNASFLYDPDRGYSLFLRDLCLVHHLKKSLLKISNFFLAMTTTLPA